MAQQRVMTERERRTREEPMATRDERAIPNGPAAAAVLAAGIGTLTLGLLTTLAEALPALRTALNIYNPAGPLSGKTTVAMLVWLISWVVLHFMWKDRNVNFATMFTAGLVLIALGFLGTFPIFFEMFTAR